MFLIIQAILMVVLIASFIHKVFIPMIKIQKHVNGKAKTQQENFQEEKEKIEDILYNLRSDDMQTFLFILCYPKEEPFEAQKTAFTNAKNTVFKNWEFSFEENGKYIIHKKSKKKLLLVNKRGKWLYSSRR